MAEFNLKESLDTEGEWPSHWPEWVIAELDKLEKIEKRFPRDILSDAPQWVGRMSLKVVQLTHPSTRYQSEQSGASFLGSTFGHLNWLIVSEDGLPALTERYVEASNDADTKIRARLGEAKYNKLILKMERAGVFEEATRITKSIYRVLLRKAKVIENCLSEALSQPIAEQADFFEAYAKALKTPPLDQSGSLLMEKSTGVGNIYLLMVLYWKTVQRMDSVTKVHSWLCSIYPPSLVGDLDRVRKMCLRFGIRLTKPGRPRKK